MVSFKKVYNVCELLVLPQFDTANYVIMIIISIALTI